MFLLDLFDNRVNDGKVRNNNPAVLISSSRHFSLIDEKLRKH